VTLVLKNVCLIYYNDYNSNTINIFELIKQVYSTLLVNVEVISTLVILTIYSYQEGLLLLAVWV